MFVTASGQNFLFSSPGAGKNRQSITEPTGTDLPSGKDSGTVNISQAGQSHLERELQRLEQGAETHQLFDLRGAEGKYRLGLIALGTHTVSEWREKGLELSEESILAAADAFQAALQHSVQTNGSSAAEVALNRHQLVMSHQEVPEWFVQEYEACVYR